MYTGMTYRYGGDWRRLENPATPGLGSIGAWSVAVERGKTFSNLAPSSQSRRAKPTALAPTPASVGFSTTV